MATSNSSLAPAPILPVPDGPAVPISGDALNTNDLSAKERKVLLRTISIIKQARVKLKSQSKEEVTAAQSKLLAALTYLSGFLDGSGLLQRAQLNPGFEATFGSRRSSLDDTDRSFDDYLTQLEKTLRTPPTRLEPIGLLIGGGYVIVGIGFRALGAYIQGSE